MSFLLNCERVAALLSDYQDGSLPWIVALRVRVHLASCQACRSVSGTLRAVPGLVARVLAAEPVGVPPEAKAALARVLTRLKEEPRELVAPTPVPEGVRVLQAEGKLDESFRLLALAHRAFRSVLPREDEPHLPQELTRELAPREQWIWQQRGGLTFVELFQDAFTGSRLNLVWAPAGYRVPFHSHQGSESLLILEGGMRDEAGDHEAGQWVHYGNGTRHTPVMTDEGCWCLVREDGGQRFEGPLGWVRNLLAA